MQKKYLYRICFINAEGTRKTDLLCTPIVFHDRHRKLTEEQIARVFDFVKLHDTSIAKILFVELLAVV